jgi:predicted CopG family antitoxin
MPKSTILVESMTRERLKKIGRKGESYDELINQLLNLKKEVSLENGIETPSPERHSGT